MAVKTGIGRILTILVMIIRTWLMGILSLHQLQLCLHYSLHRIWWFLLFLRFLTHVLLPFAENTLLLFAHITMYIVFFIRSSTSLPPCFALYVVLILCNYCYGVIDLWVLLLKGKKWYLNHYNDVIMGAIASQITSLTIVYPTVYSGADQRNIKAPRHWPLCTNGQKRGKYFHLMTSSWYITLTLCIVPLSACHS